MHKENCIFCKIVKGEIPSHIVWEDEKHIAFLDIFPAVEGMTVLVPRKHHQSYFADLDKVVVCDLMVAASEVAKLLDSKLERVLRTKLVLEGLDVDHLHAKLYPMYEGRPTPEHGSGKASDEDLRRVVEKIRS
jgi:histidine triad (HIT) family protein